MFFQQKSTFNNEYKKNLQLTFIKYRTRVTSGMFC